MFIRPFICAFMSIILCVHLTIRTLMIRPSCNQQAIRAFMIRFSCVHFQNLVRSSDLLRSCPDVRAFTRLSFVHQTIRAFLSRFLCIHKTFVFSCLNFCVFIRLFVRRLVKFTDKVLHRLYNTCIALILMHFRKLRVLACICKSIHCQREYP